MAENKKDSFTFSDKIKNSKPAFNPFSKRASSKIGNNGKPKKTLFERTRRDAPFMAAGAAALLLLPFLYKYSGNVQDNDGSKIVTPGVSDEFVPERFDYDPAAGVPEGNLAQLSGRDPLSLIKGWGEPEVRPDVRDGLGDAPVVTRPQAQQAYRPQNSYRPQAPAQVRASIARNPTKINKLGGPSGLNFRGGAGIGMRFGGSELKQAARESSAPRRGPSIKPVSLQPLRAAGNPSRAYYGNQGVAQARASRDAMSKASAPEALRDALFTALPSRGGRSIGEASSSSGGPGAPGNFERNNEYKSMKPWWWNMAEQKAMKKWEWKYFLWRKNLVEPLIKGLAENLVKFMGLSMSCLLTATDDWSAGSMGATEGSPAVKPHCKIGDSKYFELSKLPEKAQESCGGMTLKDCCKKILIKENDNWEWKDGSDEVYQLSYLGRVRHCFNNSYKGKKSEAANGGYGAGAGDEGANGVGYSGGIWELNRCHLLPHKVFQVDTVFPKKWHRYIAVAVRNTKINGNYLCQNSVTRTMALNQRLDLARMANQTSSLKIGDPANGASNNYQSGLDTSLPTPTFPRISSSGTDVDNACVVFVDNGDEWNYEEYVRLVKGLLKKKGFAKDNQEAEEIFATLIPLFIEGYAMEIGMTPSAGHGGNFFKGVPGYKYLPMSYAEFEERYILSADYLLGKDSPRLYMYTGEPYTILGNERQQSFAFGTEPTAARVNCSFSGFAIKADEIAKKDTITATVSYPKSHKQLTVTAVAKGLDGSQHNLTVTRSVRVVGAAQISDVYNASPVQGDTLPDEFTVVWVATDGEHEETDTAEYYGVEPVVVIPTPTEQECEEGQTKYVNRATQASTTEQPDDLETVCYDMSPCLNGSWGISHPSKGCNPEEPTAPVSLAESFSTIGASVNGSALYPSCQLDTVRTVDAEQRFEAVPLTNKIREVFTKAKTAFEQKNTGKTLTIPGQEEKVVALPKLLDALYILGQSDQVPVNAVCMAGRAIGRSVADPQVPQLPNMLGAFVAYMGNNSSYFPTQYVMKNNEKQSSAFRGCNGAYEITQVGRQYHYGHYNWNYKKLRDTRRPEGVYHRGFYLQELTNGPWGVNYSLGPIMQIVRFEEEKACPDEGKCGASQNETLDSANRWKYHETYKEVFSGTGDCFESNATMSWSQVSEYLKGVCSNPQAKPKGSGPEFKCGSKFQPDAGASTL